MIEKQNAPLTEQDMAVIETLHPWNEPLPRRSGRSGRSGKSGASNWHAKTKKTATKIKIE